MNVNGMVRRGCIDGDIDLEALPRKANLVRFFQYALREFLVICCETYGGGDNKNTALRCCKSFFCILAPVYDALPRRLRALGQFL